MIFGDENFIQLTEVVNGGFVGDNINTDYNYYGR